MAGDTDRRERGSSLMRAWERLLDSFDTSGGHIVVLAVLMVVGIVAHKNGYEKADDVISGAFGALLMALRPANSNHHRYSPDREPHAPESGSLTVTETKKTSTTAVEPDK